MTSDLICAHLRFRIHHFRLGPQARTWWGRRPMRSPPRHFALCAVLLAPLLWGQKTLAAEPYRMLSPSGEAPHAAVLLVPGCSGFGAVNGVSLYDERAGDLQAAGYVVVFVDYLGRFSNCGYISHAQVGEDILAAATWARAQVGVDPGRISVIGWSYGGGGVLAALRAMPSGPPIFAKAVMYYPDCRGETPWSAAGVAALMLMGAGDDVARPAVCDPVVGGASPNKLRAVSYPNALHAFDMRGLPERTKYPFGTIGYNAEAANASWATVLDFLR
jgi:dienelactone hydrolase